MPIIQSAAKRVRQSDTRYRRNLRYKRAMRVAVKDVTDAIKQNDESDARAKLQTAQKAIDKAVKRGVIHKNTAARKKSQLARQIETTFGGATKSAAKPAAKKQPAKKQPAKKTSTAKSTTKKSSTTSKSQSSSKTTKSS